MQEQRFTLCFLSLHCNEGSSLIIQAVIGTKAYDSWTGSKHIMTVFPPG